jgi:hypothetical protein
MEGEVKISLRKESEEKDERPGELELPADITVETLGLTSDCTDLYLRRG